MVANQRHRLWLSINAKHLHARKPLVSIAHLEQQARGSPGSSRPLCSLPQVKLGASSGFFWLVPGWVADCCLPSSRKLWKACSLGCLHRSGLAASALWHGVVRLLSKISCRSKADRARSDNRKSISGLPGASAGSFCRQSSCAGSAEYCTDARSASINSAARCTRSSVVLLL